MAENSAIEWTDHTWSPWEGCTKVSPGCDHCYAEGMNRWLRKGENWGPGAPRRTYSDEHWAKPHRWNYAAARTARYVKVFPSVCDPFDNAAPNGERERFARLILATPNLIWLLLTKRIGNAAAMLADMFPGGLQENVWLGATVVNQEEADRDIPKLLATPARVRFLSMEPLLGPVDLSRWLEVAPQVGQHFLGLRALDHQKGNCSGQQRDGVPLAGDLPHGDRLPAMLLDAGMVPPHEAAEGLLQPLHHAGVRVVDRQPSAVRASGATAPVQVPLPVEQAGEVRNLPNLARDGDGLIAENWPGAAGEPLSSDFALDAGSARAESPTDAFDGLAGAVSLRNSHAPTFVTSHVRPLIDWVIVGGESGRGARPMHLSWVSSIVQQCRAAGVPVFVKQLGRQPIDDTAPADAPDYLHDVPWQLMDRKGGDWSEWPEDLRVRQFPEVR